MLEEGCLDGLVLRLSEHGRKTWCHLYRAHGSRRLRRLALGTYPAVTLADARGLALENRRGVQVKGENPADVATVLSELAGKIDPEKLVAAAAAAAVPWAQRLGYLLEFVGGGDKTAPLERYVRAGLREGRTRTARPKAGSWAARRSTRPCRIGRRIGCKPLRAHHPFRQ